jgi:hypothetical protein
VETCCVDDAVDDGEEEEGEERREEEEEEVALGAGGESAALITLTLTFPPLTVMFVTTVCLRGRPGPRRADLSRSSLERTRASLSRCSLCLLLLSPISLSLSSSC